MPTAIVVPFGVDNGEVKEVAAFIHTIWIYTKILKDSQIIMDITYHDNRVIHKEDIRYGKYFKELNKTELAPISIFAVNGKKYKCIYEVSKDQNDYDLKEITNLGISQRLTIALKVASKTRP